jgi:hypothetical protein
LYLQWVNKNKKIAITMLVETSMKDEKGKTRTTRATEKRDIPSPHDRSRKSRTSKTSRADGDIGSGANRENWQGADLFLFLGSIGGGIIAQLIRTTEDQLSEARACIEWYQRKEQESVASLQELQKLKELVQQNLSASAAEVSNEEE